VSGSADTRRGRADDHIGFRIDAAACDGCMSCMRVCPTDAIRVRDGTAVVKDELCIDCGACLSACPHEAISARTRTLEEFAHYKFKVAVPSPVLFGQFPLEIRPREVIHGLIAAGFDAVWEYGVELALVNRATIEYIRHWQGPRPLISVMCPVIVQLLQVSYPRMLEQLVRLVLPRELAAREMKRNFSREMGLPEEDIAAIYITPCQAKTHSIWRPAEGGRSFLDGAVGIAQLYNAVLSEATEADKTGRHSYGWNPVRSAGMVRWATQRPLADLLGRQRYLSVDGLANVIKVLDDVEKGKLRGIDFLECRACWGGCPGGNLTVENVYVSQAKLYSLIADLPDRDPGTEAAVDRRYPGEDVYQVRVPEPRSVENGGGLRERVRRLKEAERIEATLPGLDCQLCGSPSCGTFAHDVADGDAGTDECVFLSPRRIDELRRIYQRGREAGDG